MKKYLFLIIIFSKIIYGSIDENHKSQNLLISLDHRYNTIVHYSQKFKDNSFYLKYQMNQAFDEKWEFGLSAYLENKKFEPVYENSKYFNDEFLGLSGDLESSYIKYSSKNLRFKIGRDYFSMGKDLKDRIVFNTNGYPYDKLVFSVFKNNLSISSYYLHLNDMTSSINDFNHTYRRHLNGHRIKYKFNNGYIALNELAIYGGENQNIHFPLFNPFNLLYVYQLNNKFNLNTVLSLDILYEMNKNSFFLELVLDDIQIEKNNSMDLEPAEIGFMFDFMRNINTNIKYNFNFTLISNRTFNAPVYEYEKMIYKNFPIGHILGNNFWKIESSMTFINNIFSLSAGSIYIEKGEEALFSEFNTDYLDYDVDEGYKEEFPFGDKKIMSGFILEIKSNKYQKINLNTKISYWHNTFIDNHGLNFSTSINYFFDL